MVKGWDWGALDNHGVSQYFSTCNRRYGKRRMYGSEMSIGSLTGRPVRDDVSIKKTKVVKLLAMTIKQ